MTPLTEWKDLLSRSRNLFSAVLLVFITFALLVVSVVTLFCTCWLTVFRTARGIAEQMTARVAVPELLR
jgi:preprotein translocase subunit SecY